MQSENKLHRLVGNINRAPLFLRSWLLTQLFGRTIRFAGTAGVQVLELHDHQSKLMQGNFKRVQNHIGSVHAAAMALLGESCSGFLLGMHVPDQRLPLLKSMNLHYVKRATGRLTAVATLSDSEIAHIRQSDKGEICIKVCISDQLGVEPVIAEFTWAWIPKK